MIFSPPSQEKCKVAVIGLGYVGLPLAIEISKIKKSFLSGNLLKREIIGFDINIQRLKDLSNNFDHTNEVNEEDLRKTDIKFTNIEQDLIEAEVFIITVPTPIDNSNQPDLKCLNSASMLVAEVLVERKKIRGVPL